MSDINCPACIGHGPYHTDQCTFYPKRPAGALCLACGANAENVPCAYPGGEWVIFIIRYMDGLTLHELRYRAHCAECARSRFERGNRDVRVVTVMMEGKG